MNYKRITAAALCAVTLLLCTASAQALVNWGTRVEITEYDTVLDSITYNGVTVDALYAPIAEMGQAAYDSSRYSCSDFVRRFYREAMGIELKLGYTGNDEPQSLSGGVFVRTLTPSAGDLVTKISGSHYAIVKVTEGNTAVLIEQNLWSDRSRNIALKERSLTDDENYVYWHWCLSYNEDQVKSFVRRLYELCLGRQPDEKGFANWVKKLTEGTVSAAETVRGFFLSKEMANMQLSDDEYVERCYAVLMDREPDEGGKAGWVQKLSDGISRMGVLKGFVESKEFTKLCASYTITRGSLSAAWRDRNPGLTAYVVRLYRMILGREYDAAGLNGWCRKILTGAFTAKSAAVHGFFHSPEFMKKERTDEEFLQILYRTFLDREYDEGGLAYWLEQLENGASRDRCIAGFADSREFRALMESYGL